MGRFILRKGRPRKDGRVTLTFSGHVGGHRIFAGTGLAVRPEDWDDFRQQVRRTDTNYAQINAKLREIQARFDHEVAALTTVDRDAVERIRRQFSRKGDPDEPASDEEMTFWSGFDTFITTKATDRGERTIAKYRTLHTILHEFEGGYGHLSSEVITHDFYDALKNFLIMKRGLTNNTFGKYVTPSRPFSLGPRIGEPLSQRIIASSRLMRKMSMSLLLHGTNSSVSKTSTSPISRV